MDERPHISASQITTWLQCRLKHHFTQTLPREEEGGKAGERMQVGTLVHAVMEEHLALPPAQRTTATMQDAYETACEDFESEEVQDKAFEILNRYWHTCHEDADWMPTDFEVELRQEIIPGLDLLGYADELWIDAGKRAIVIGEKKTTLSKPDLLVTPFLNVQGQCYRYLVEQQYPGYRLDKIVYSMFWRQGFRRIERPLTDTGPQWDAWLRAIAHDMQQLPVRMEPGHWCRGCKFNQICLESVMTGMDVLDLTHPSEGWISAEGDEDEGM